MEFQFPNTDTKKNRFMFSVKSTTVFETRKSILVVDDNENIRELLSVLLHDEGDIYTALNGLDALSMFAGNHYDIVVSDVEMPVMNGIELHKIVAQVYKDPFLFFSGTVNEEHIRYIEDHNLMLFRKPGDMLKMQSWIKNVLHRVFPKNVL